jgi:hypothetical protein
MDWYDDVILPKLWTEVIRRWWDAKVPTDYPTDSGVEFTLDFGDNKDAVTAMEESLKTEESVVTPFIPEDTFVGQYAGAFEAEGEGGEQILLSPVKINASQAIALHYNADTDGWENVENVNVVDGYVYGDLATLSPIAVFAVHKDIVETDEAVEGMHTIMGNGNPVQIFVEDEKIYAMNASSGKKIEIDPSTDTRVFGGTFDGSAVDKCSVSVVGVEAAKLYVYGGSTGSDDFVAKVGNVKVLVKDSKIAGVTGSHYKAHTANVDIEIINSTVKGFIASGQSWYTAKRKDGNKAKPDDSSDFITENVTMNLDGAESDIVYPGGNSGYTYTKNSTVVIKNSKIKWVVSGSSNGRVDKASIEAYDSEFNITQTTNRGTVGSGSILLDGVSVTSGIYIAGDASDSTVNGTVDEIRYEINKGTSGTVFLGTNAGEELADNAIVKYVKYSRSANIDFSDNVKEVLGEKLKVK